MTKLEAVRVVRLIARVHMVDPDEALVDGWYNTVLQNCDYELGLQIARDLAGKKDRMPKPVHFRELLNAHNRHPDNQQPALPEGGEKTIEIGHKHIAEIRAMLKG